MSEALPIRDARPKDFFWAHNRLIDDYGRIIGADGVAVYMALCRHAGESQTCWPSYQTIADELSLSRPTVVKAIKKLVAASLISIEARNDPEHPDHHLSNLYTLLVIPSAVGGGKGDLPRVVKEVNHPSKAGLPTMVNVVNQGGKGGLHEENTEKKTHLKEEGAIDNDAFEALLNSPDPFERTTEQAIPNSPPAKVPQVAPQGYSPLAVALAELCGISLQRGSAPQKRALREAVEALREQNATPEQVQHFARYWKDKGKTRLPRPDFVVADWRDAMYSYRPLAQAGGVPDDETPEEQQARFTRVYEKYFKDRQIVHPSTYRVANSGD